VYEGNPLMLTGDMANINITLTDPDTDEDGMPDWWELEYGLNPSSGVSSALAGWWKFDEGSGTNAYNSVSGGYNGQLMNMTTSSWVEGRMGGAVWFDGTNDYVRIPQNPAIITGNEFTVSAWVWLDGDAASIYPSVIADMEVCGDYQGLWLGAESVANWMGTVGSCASAIYPYTQGQTTSWVHLAMTHDGTTTRLYVNGVAGTSDAVTFVPAEHSEIRIGWADDPYFTYLWKGRLDDIRLYTVGMTSNDIMTMNDALGDMDGDGLVNLQEYQLGTDPNDSDTDGDGLPDSVDRAPCEYDHELPEFSIEYPTQGMVIL
jgi:hypothetical protein